MERYTLAWAFFAMIVASQAAELLHVRHDGERYAMSYWQARKKCKDMGASLATKIELEESLDAGYSNCACGWTADKTAWFPMTEAVTGCGGRRGMHECTWRERWDAYCYKGDPTGNCSAPLGIESDEITDHQLMSSSEYESWYPLFSNSRWRAQVARLNNYDTVNAWRPESNNRKYEYLEVDLETPTAVSGILSQGAKRLGTKMWVTSYTVKYSKDGVNYKSIKEDEDDMIFTANTNNNGIVRNMFPEPILTQYIRIIPYTWHNHIAMRIELLGCEMEVYKLARSMARDIVVRTMGGERATVDTGEKEPEK